jgi:hypothetical protein
MLSTSMQKRYIYSEKSDRRISELDHLFLGVTQLLQNATDAALREIATSRTRHGFDHAAG